MKNRLAVFAAVALISTGAFAQKDELKTLKKLYDKPELNDKDLLDYKAAVAKAETMSGTASEADKLYIDFYKAMTPILEATLVMSKPENQSNQMLQMKYLNMPNITNLSKALPAVVEYEKTSGKKVYTSDIEQTVATFSPTLLNYAVVLGNQKNHKEAAAVLYNTYLLDKRKTDNLYYAASYATNGQDYEAALKYYNELKAMNYSGEGTAYIAKSLASGKDDTFPNKADRDKMISLKTHITPREEKLPSKRGEIYKNIALILVQQGKTEEAKAAITEAKRLNPDDTSLLLTEADLYLTLKDTETYKKLISEILAKNPNDADLVFNMGVLAMQAEQLTEAETYFTRALAINPKYVNAYLNMAAVKLKADTKIVAEMNKLGTSQKDNQRYEALKKQRSALFTSVLPYLEKGHELDPTNDNMTDNLLSVYNFLEMTDKYKALKASR